MDFRYTFFSRLPMVSDQIKSRASRTSPQRARILPPTCATDNGITGIAPPVIGPSFRQCNRLGSRLADRNIKRAQAFGYRGLNTTNKRKPFGRVAIGRKPPGRTNHKELNMKRTITMLALSASILVLTAGTALAGPCGRGGFGERGFGKASFGRHGHRHGQRAMRALSVFHKLEMLSSETAPEAFNLDRHPDADTNGDGELSQAEWTTFAAAKKAEILARLLERKPELDSDKSGEISNEELAAFRADVMAKVYAKIIEHRPEADTDGNGELSDEEFAAFKAERQETHRARMLRSFPDADTNGDGTLSQDEARAFKQAMRDERLATFLENHPEADTDENGTLTGQEIKAFFQARKQERLQQVLENHPEADLNNDGTLSRDEMKEFFKSQRGQFKKGFRKGKGGGRGGDTKFGRFGRNSA